MGKRVEIIFPGKLWSWNVWNVNAQLCIKTDVWRDTRGISAKIVGINVQMWHYEVPQKKTRVWIINEHYGKNSGSNNQKRDAMGTSFYIREAWYFDGYGGKNGQNVSLIVALENYWLFDELLDIVIHKIQMYDSIKFEEFSHVYLNRYESYKEFIPEIIWSSPSNALSVIEPSNGWQRHWLVAFRRRSIVVTRTLENLAISMALAIRFRINGSIDELTTLLKCISYIS